LTFSVEILSIVSMNKTDKKKLTWLFGQPEEILIEAIKHQRDLYFELRSKQKELDPNQITLVSLIKTAEHFFNAEHPTVYKDRDHDLEALRKKVMERIQRHKIRHTEKIKSRKKRGGKKKRKITQLMAEIVIMREQGQSYKAIADYIEKYHKLKLHPTYVSKLLHAHEGKQ